MGLVDTAQDKLEDQLNSHGRGAGHVAIGVAVCAAIASGTALIALKRTPPAGPAEQAAATDGVTVKPSKPTLSLLLPTLFSLSSLSALRIWNAPSSPRRTRALALWGVMQAVNAALVWAAPKRRSAQLVGAVATASITAAYAETAKRIDTKAAGMVAPYAGLMSFTSAMAGDVRRSREQGASRSLH
ncbi:tryptophan-rich sensory protein [Caulobacter sp. NIBR2454]|uniref:tryptophan-rich sensory protein n=1 Tax=Caulobacter sp. NIBR2454 TaxID=3015996 RepID=UPI0022B6E87F|nr:tryptophan-rich sensory protein [Caulobacter sp. NIBR2454]